MKPGNLTPRLYFLRERRELRKMGATKEDLKKFSDYEKALIDVAKSMEKSNDEYVRKQCLRYLHENYQRISVALRCENKELFKGENSAKT